MNPFLFAPKWLMSQNPAESSGKSFLAAWSVGTAAVFALLALVESHAPVNFSDVGLPAMLRAVVALVDGGRNL